MGTMPKVVRSQPWEISFREEVSSLAKGWNVKERRGKVFLRVRSAEKETSLYLPSNGQRIKKEMQLIGSKIFTTLLKKKAEI